MVDIEGVDAAHATRPRLGRVLVDAGLLNDEQLQAALAEQTRTGRRLGEIVVERGYMSGAALANALATQHGGVVRTEYGIATGLPPAAAAPAPVPEPNAPDTPERTESLSIVSVLEDWSGLLEDLRGQVASLESELAAAREELAVSQQTVDATTAALESAKRDLEATRAEARSAQERVDELEREREPAVEPVPTQPLPVAREVHVHTAGNGRDPLPVAETHLMSVPTPSGFVLLERPGPTPSVGTQVRFEEEPDTTFVVTKVNAASELNPRPCAFLERL